MKNSNYYSRAQYLIGLEMVRKKRSEDRTDDLISQANYGDILIINKKYQEAFDFFCRLYQKHYLMRFGVGQMIKCLFALGKTEKDFDWIVPPRILRLDTQTLVLCSKLIKINNGLMNVGNLYDELFIYLSDYTSFDQVEFAEFLIKNNDKFIIKGNISDSFSLQVEVRD